METNSPPLEDDHNRVARERMLTDLEAIAAHAETLLQATAHDVSDEGKAFWARVVVRVRGSWIAATGLLLIGWNFRAWI